MATTTNYSWSTPDDTALVKDGAAAIRSLGTAIDTTVFTNAGAAIAKTIVDAKGDLIVGTAADTVARLASSASNGNVLTVDTSTATGLKWAAPAGGGKVLQVIYGSTATTLNSTTASYVDTGLTATITPSATSSKILVLINQIVGKTGGDTYIDLDVLRGSTSITSPATFLTGYAGNNGGSANNYIGAVSASILDTPATTSATTYKTVARNPNAAGTVKANEFALSTMILMEIGA